MSLFVRSSRAWLAIAAVGSLVAACHHEPKGTPAATLPPVTVRTLELATSAQQGQEEVVGTVRARLRATLEAKVSGRIEKMPVTLGARIAAGALVAQLEVGEIAAKLAQAEALLAQATLEADRVTQLMSQSASTPQAYDAVMARKAVAAAAVVEAKTMLDYATVRAPFAGVVSYKLAEVGDLATPGRPLVELEDPSRLRLEIAVPEAVVANVKLGQRVPVRIAAIAEQLEARVAELAPAADPTSRTFVAKLELPQDERLRTGQFGRALIPAGTRQTLRVPATAVAQRGQMEVVHVAKDGQARLRLIKTGRAFADEVEVLAGLEPGDVLVLASPAAVRDGQPLVVTP